MATVSRHGYSTEWQHATKVRSASADMYHCDMLALINYSYSVGNNNVYSKNLSVHIISMIDHLCSLTLIGLIRTLMNIDDKIHVILTQTLKILKIVWYIGENKLKSTNLNEKSWKGEILVYFKIGKNIQINVLYQMKWQSSSTRYDFSTPTSMSASEISSCTARFEHRLSSEMFLICILSKACSLIMMFNSEICMLMPNLNNLAFVLFFFYFFLILFRICVTSGSRAHARTSHRRILN